VEGSAYGFDSSNGFSSGSNVMMLHKLVLEGMGFGMLPMLFVEALLSLSGKIIYGGPTQSLASITL